MVKMTVKPELFIVSELISWNAEIDVLWQMCRIVWYLLSGAYVL